MIKRYVASADTTITNGFKLGNKKRGVDSNMGAADSLELYVAYNAATSGSREESRILLKFPIENLVSDRVNEDLAPAGDVRFFLKLFNVVHPETVPRRLSVQVFPLTKDWEEGDGMDLDNYTDPGASAGGTGATWISPQKGISWETEGGDVGAQFVGTYLEKGIEDIVLDVTDFVEDWIENPQGNYGLAIKIDDVEQVSKYTKKISSRTSEFWFKRPILEACWNSSIDDRRNNFSRSSILRDSSENLNTIYFYNYHGGVPRDLPDTLLPVLVDVYEDLELANIVLQDIPAYRVSEGIYAIDLELETSALVLYDVWKSGPITLHTDKIKVASENIVPLSGEYLTKAKQREIYSQRELARIRVFVRKKKKDLNIYTKTQTTSEFDVISNLHFKITRLADMEVVLDYDTAKNSTLLSNDLEGSFFDLDMGIFQKDYAYGINFGHMISGRFVEIPGTFKFRVEGE